MLYCKKKFMGRVLVHLVESFEIELKKRRKSRKLPFRVWVVFEHFVLFMMTRHHHLRQTRPQPTLPFCWLPPSWGDHDRDHQQAPK